MHNCVLEATFREYFCEKQAWENIPVLKMIARTKDELLAQAEEISWELNSCSCSGKIAVTESSAVIGGGSLPGETMPDYAVEIPEKKLRSSWQTVFVCFLFRLLLI